MAVMTDKQVRYLPVVDEGKPSQDHLDRRSGRKNIISNHQFTIDQLTSLFAQLRAQKEVTGPEHAIIVGNHACQRGMPIAELDEFLEVASAALPRITEIIVAFPAEHRAGALEVAERRYRQAARDFGCTEADSERWVAAVMRKLRTLVEQSDPGT